MFAERDAPHHLPHFRARYQEHLASFSMEPIELIAGYLPKKQQRLVEAWAELHKEELMKDWELLDQGSKPLPIDPLK